VREGEPGSGNREPGDVPADPGSRFPIPACRLSDFPPDGLLGVTLPDGTPVCLVRHDGAVHALHDRCTHAEYSLSAGELRADGTVQCLWHGATFDCRTGAVRRGPATDPVPTFAVRVEGDAVFVEGNRVRESGIGTALDNDRQ
jgi:3-phenylpropionate/trans-cinnamate dioxygenase ferredoxin subunit